MQMVIRLKHLVVCSMWVRPFLKQSVFFRPKKGKYRSSDFSPRRRRRPFLRGRLLVSIFPATRKYTPHAESEARQHMAVQRSAVRPCIHVKPSWLSPTQTYLIGAQHRAIPRVGGRRACLSMCMQTPPRQAADIADTAFDATGRNFSGETSGSIFCR